MTLVYLAGRYDRQAELAIYARQVNESGHICISRWLDPKHNNLPQKQVALDDAQDVMDCNTFVLFSHKPEDGYGKGGSHVEFGIAWTMGKRIMIVGDYENIFHWLPGVEQYDTWEEALDNIVKGE